MLKLLKLTTGEEILGQFRCEPSIYYASDVVMVHPVPSEDGGMSLQFIPWTMTMFSQDNKVEIYVDQIVAETEVAVELQERYLKIFKNSILTPSSSLITG